MSGAAARSAGIPTGAEEGQPPQYTFWYTASVYLVRVGSSLNERFDANVDRSGVHHFWLGATKADGSGTFKLKGGKVVTVPLAPHTARALDLVMGERCEGPILVGREGKRLDRHAAARRVAPPGSTRRYRQTSRTRGSDAM